MSPTNKVHLFVTTTTIAVMCYFIQQAPNWAPSLSHVSPVSKTVLAYLGSAAFYQFLASTLRWFLDHSTFARRLTLGPEYIEGTWIGCYRNREHHSRLTVEHVEQTIDGIVIRGFTFTAENNRPLVNWISSAASVDSTRGTLTFSYNLNVAASSSAFQGIAEFAFEREGSRKPPKFFNGYSAILTDDRLFFNREQLISRAQIALPAAWAMAREKFSSQTQ